jgi:flagellin
MRILTNVAALNSWRNLQNSGNAMSKNLERLSSGMRINRASDDAAGLTISEKMRAQIRGLNQAQRNAQDGISMIQTAEGAMSEIQNMLQRMRELAVQSASDGLDDTDRKQIQKEVDQLAFQITDIAKNTQFNTKKLLKGDYASGTDGADGADGAVGADDITIQTGANASENLSFNIEAVDAAALGVGSVDAEDTLLGGISVSTRTAADSAVDTIDSAIEKVSGYRSELGALQNRLEYSIANTQSTAENLQAAESRIRDVDMAQEMTAFTKNQILVQAGTAMLAQANQLPQSVLKLLD